MAGAAAARPFAAVSGAGVEAWESVGSGTRSCRTLAMFFKSRPVCFLGAVLSDRASSLG